MDVVLNYGVLDLAPADVVRVPQPIFLFVFGPKISTFAYDELIE